MVHDVVAKIRPLGDNGGPPWLDTAAGAEAHSLAQVVTSYGPGSGKLRRRSGENHAASGVSGTRSHINDVISACHDLKVVLNDDQRRPSVNEFIEKIKQSGDIGVMKPRSWFIQDDTQR